MARKGRHRKGGRVTPKGTRPPGFRPKGGDARGGDGGAGVGDGDPFGSEFASGPGVGPELRLGSGPDRLAPAANTGNDADELFRGLQRSLDEGPHVFLAEVSTMASIIEEVERPSPFEPKPEAELTTRADVIDAFFATDQVLTSALLVAISRLLGDEVLIRRVDREVARRGHRLPRWLAEIDQAEVVGAYEMIDVYGDTEDVVLDVGFTDGNHLTGVLLVDHDAGSVARDGFASDLAADTLTETVQESATYDLAVTALGPADAAARACDAIDHGARMWPPFESDTWPMSRPLLRWMAGLAPDGGQGYPYVEWSEDDRNEVAEGFLKSEEGSPLREPSTAKLRHQRELLDDLLWFATAYDRADPLRWSPMRVERVLLDLVPRKLAYPTGQLRTFPDLLSRFVRYSHHERGVDARHTTETLGAIDAVLPEYQEAISGKRLQGPLALLDQMGAVDQSKLGPDDVFDPALFDALDGTDHPEVQGIDTGPLPDEQPWAASMLDDLADSVGGVEVLDGLGTEALPEEPFDWSVVPGDCRERVAEILALTDRACDELFDAEHRTACRRLLARAAQGDPAIFRRKGRADTAAGAVLWLVGKANRTVASYGRGPGLATKDLAAHLGTSGSSFSQRAATFAKAAGLFQIDWTGSLGDPTLLTSTTRHRFIAQRDRLRSMLEGEG